MTERSRLRLAFAALVVVAVGQVVVHRTVGEPYPALFAPHFATVRDRGGYVVEVLPVATLVDRDGMRHRVLPHDLTYGPSNPQAAFGHLTDRDVMRDTGTHAWLCARLRALGAADPVAFEVVAKEQTISTRTGELLRSRAADRIVVNLECGP